MNAHSHNPTHRKWNIIYDPQLRVQYRKPKSKKRRIIEKWAEDGRNYKADEQVYVMEITKTIICHPMWKHKVDAIMRGENVL